MKYCFGVDIGGTTVKMGLFTTEGMLLDKWEIKTHTVNKGESILPDIAQAIMDKMREKDILKDDMESVGVGVPAPVNENGVVQNTVNLGWATKK